jgi:hypothetical protein
MTAHKRSTPVYSIYVGKRKRGGTSIRKHLGIGFIGQLLKHVADQQADERRRRHRAEIQLRQALRAAVQLSCSVIREMKHAVATQMAKRGYFQHARGEWRRRHRFAANQSQMAPESQMGRQMDQDLGETAAAANLAITTWLELLSRTNNAAASAIIGQLGTWRQELLADGASPIELLCAERAIVCRVEMEVVAAVFDSPAPKSTVHSANLASRILAAHRRLSAAIRTLHDVRARYGSGVVAD